VIKAQLFSERLKMLREEKNISVKELGEAVGTSGATISRYETGVHEPKSKMVRLLADYFDVNPAWLMGANVDRNNKDEDVVLYNEPVIFNQLPGDLKDFIIKEESVPYLVLAKHLSESDVNNLSEKEIKFMIDCLKLAINK
jgi:transcriptional regulator with XRE-family HTH domain